MQVLTKTKPMANQNRNSRRTKNRKQNQTLGIIQRKQKYNILLTAVRQLTAKVYLSRFNL